MNAILILSDIKKHTNNMNVVPILQDNILGHSCSTVTGWRSRRRLEALRAACLRERAAGGSSRERWAARAGRCRRRRARLQRREAEGRRCRGPEECEARRVPAVWGGPGRSERGGTGRGKPKPPSAAGPTRCQERELAAAQEQWPLRSCFPGGWRRLVRSVHWTENFVQQNR